MPAQAARQHRAVERVAERLGTERRDHRMLVELGARDQLHVAEAARIVERHHRAVRHVEHHVVVRGKLAALVVEVARRRGVALVQHVERARHAEMHQQHLAGRDIRQQVFGAPADAADGLALEPVGEVLRKRKAQVRPARLDAHEARALHHGLQAAAHGFDFGKLGHASLRGQPAVAPGPLPNVIRLLNGSVTVISVMPHSCSMQARAVVAIVLVGQLAMQCLHAGHIDIDAGAGRAVAVVLAEMEGERAARNLHEDRRIRRKTVLPVDREAEKAE